jgi:hypothetical protein
VLQWYIICALAELFIYILALILSHNKVPTSIFGAIARMDLTLILSNDTKKCQQAFLTLLLGKVARQSKGILMNFYLLM